MDKIAVCCGVVYNTTKDRILQARTDVNESGSARGLERNNTNNKQSESNMTVIFWYHWPYDTYS